MKVTQTQLLVICIRGVLGSNLKRHNDKPGRCTSVYLSRTCQMPE